MTGRGVPDEGRTDDRPDGRTEGRTAAARFRLTLARVMLVQLVTLVLLWLLQARYTP